MDYNTATKLLTGRNEQRKKWGNHTYLERRKENIALKYHQTDVVTFMPNGDVILNSGGWKTATTKERINWMIGDRLSQVDSVWYIDNVTFKDGITIKADGSIEGGGIPNLKADRQLKKRVKEYAKLCADSIPLDSPSGADCWYCVMHTEEGQTLGDAIKDNYHIDSHMEEGYVVPALVYNAMTEIGVSRIAWSVTFKESGYGGDSKWLTDIAKSQVQKAVYRYILRRKGYAS